MINIKAVFFDLDGMLVDSQLAALSATSESLAQFGIHVSIEKVRKRFGGGSKNLLSHFMTEALGATETQTLLSKAVQIKNTLQVKYTGQVLLLPGIKRLLAAIKSDGYLMGLATMSSKSVAEAIIKHHAIDQYFDAITTADDVTHPKPNPEILLLTMDRLGIKKNQVIFAGDSSHDLEAAYRLGIPFILADTGIYVQGKTRISLRVSALEKHIPIVNLHNLFGIFEIIKTFQSVN